MHMGFVHGGMPKGISVMRWMG